MATSQDFVNWVCGPQLLPEYLYWAFRSSEATFAAEKQGSTHQTIYMPVVSRFYALVPPLAEQQRIADILDKADALRAKRRAALAELDTLTQSIFLDMFGIRERRDKLTCRSLAALCDAPDDIRCGPFGTQLARSEYRDSGVPLWGIRHVNAEFSIHTSEFVDHVTANRLRAYSIEPGDIVMTRKGTIGNCAVYPEGEPTGIMHSDLLRLRLDPSKAEPVFVAHQLQHSPDVELQLRLISGGAVMPGINVGKLKSLEIFVPAMTMQREFVSHETRITCLKQMHQAAIDEHDALLASLQHRAFRGEL